MDWTVKRQIGPNSWSGAVSGPLEHCLLWMLRDTRPAFGYKIERVIEKYTPVEIPLSAGNFPRDLQAALDALFVAFRDGTELTHKVYASGTGVKSIHLVAHGWQDCPVVVCDCEYLPSLEGRGGQREFTEAAVRALEDGLLLAGFDVRTHWNGAGCNTVSFSVNPAKESSVHGLWLSQASGEES